LLSHVIDEEKEQASSQLLFIPELTLLSPIQKPSLNEEGIFANVVDVLPS
jgi:hypothetical protein